MYGFSFILISIIFLTSRVSSHSLSSGAAVLDIHVEVSVNDIESTGTIDGLNHGYGKQLCKPSFNFFCYYQETDDTSNCECNKIVPLDESCPDGSAKYCNNDSSRCSCWYKVGNGCQPGWAFKCKKSEVPGADWECFCEGHPVDGRCPGGYQGCCEFGFCNWCWRFLYFKSIFAMYSEPLRVAGTGYGGGPAAASTWASVVSSST